MKNATDIPPDVTASDWPAFQQQQQSDAGMFGLLAQLWLQEIDLPTLRSLSIGELNEPFVQAGGWVPSSPDPASVEQLAIEYCACFLGPKNHLPPYQSVVAYSKFQGDCIDSMKSFIEITGKSELEFDRSTMLDHAGVQFLVAQAICQGFSRVSPGDQDSLISLQKCFQQNHLDWINNYCQVAAQKSNSQFYTALFQMTQNFI